MIFDSITYRHCAPCFYTFASHAPSKKIPTVENTALDHDAITYRERFVLFIYYFILFYFSKTYQKKNINWIQQDLIYYRVNYIIQSFIYTFKVVTETLSHTIASKARSLSACFTASAICGLSVITFTR